MLFATQCETDKSVHKGTDQIKKKKVLFSKERTRVATSTLIISETRVHQTSWVSCGRHVITELKYRTTIIFLPSLTLYSPVVPICTTCFQPLRVEGVAWSA
jgi:hypothetical protein